MLEKIDIYCFSGTGNTLLAAQAMAGVFRERGVETRILPLEKSDPSAVDLSRTLGLAFPVAAQSTYPFVWDFIDRLPPGRGTGVFMVDTLHSFSGGMVGPLRKVMTRKGYRPLGAKEIKMPNNFFPGRIDPDKNERKKSAGLERARRFAAGLLVGTASWGRVPVFSGLICRFSRSRPVWELLRRRGEKFRVDPSACLRCGLCSRLCPVENISMDDLPVFAGRCRLCMRCLSFCPAGAIAVPGKNYRLYRAVEAADLLPDAGVHPAESGPARS